MLIGTRRIEFIDDAERLTDEAQRNAASTRGSPALKIKSQRDFWSGIIFLTTGLCFAVAAAHYEIGSGSSPKPGYFPLLLSGLLIVVGALVLFASLTVETEDGDRIGLFAWRPLALMASAIAMMAWTLPHLGLIVAAPLSMVVASLASDFFSQKNHWRSLFLNVAVFTALAWLIISAIMKWNIPLWPAFLASR